MSPIQVTCAIIAKESKILAAQRSETMSLPLKWEFPGGKLMEGESEEECLKREIQEELNIAIAITSKLTTSIHDYGNFSIALIPFLAEYAAGEIKLHEHRQIGWFTKEQLSTLDWAPADIPILQELIVFLP